jgi:hypothetical protein
LRPLISRDIGTSKKLRSSTSDLWYVPVTAYDLAGFESLGSNEVSAAK